MTVLNFHMIKHHPSKEWYRVGLAQSVACPPLAR